MPGSDATTPDPAALDKAEGLAQEGTDLQLTNDQTRCLRRALEMLDRGHSTRFEDELWLGFGDDWWPLRERLIRGGYIRSIGGLRDELTLTERGSGLFTQLSGGVRAAG